MTLNACYWFNHRSYGAMSQSSSLDQHYSAPAAQPTTEVRAVVAPGTQSSTESVLEQGSTHHQEEQPLNHREIAELSFAFCILWFAANWATNASLAYTTVASSTILASMSGFFT